MFQSPCCAHRYRYLLLTDTTQRKQAYPLGSMEQRFAAMPRSLAKQARVDTIGPTGAPVLLAHPDWKKPAPVLMWYHGRSVSKELDPGRYLRLIRAGIAVCAVDLPGHGQRVGPKRTGPNQTVEVVRQAVEEVPGLVEALTGSPFRAYFDPSRMAIGGMSAGGMVTLRALCEPNHPFCAALVESTAGRLRELYQTDRAVMDSEELARVSQANGTDSHEQEVSEDGGNRFGMVGREHFPQHEPAAVEAIDPSAHLNTWNKAIRLLAIHSKADAVVPFEIQKRFLHDLQMRYRQLGADPDCIELLAFEQTGAPMEHAGFGQMGARAKDAATAFLTRVLVDGQLCDGVIGSEVSDSD